jgi:hypothetical protein
LERSSIVLDIPIKENEYFLFINFNISRTSFLFSLKILSNSSIKIIFYSWLFSKRC